MEGYLVFLAISTGTFALFSLGLNLQWGFAGLINFGHVAFMTLGAYTTALLTLPGFLQEMPERITEEVSRRPLLIQWLLQGINRLILLPLQPLFPEQVPLAIAVFLGAILAAILGLLIGLATLRLREDYLSIVTIGVAEIVRLVILNEEWLTRGTFGVQRFPLPGENWDPNFFGKVIAIAILTITVLGAGGYMWQWILKRRRQVRPLSFIGWVILGFLSTLLGIAIYVSTAASLNDYNYKSGLLLILLVVLALLIWQLERLVHSPWGRVLKAIREDEEVPRALGKNVFSYKVQALMLGGAITSIAGSFYAWQQTSIYPDDFIPLTTFEAWIIVLLGGSGNNAGVLLGATIFWAYNAVTRFVLPELVPLDDARLGALRVMVIGLLLIVLMVWRPQGILGKKEELTLGK